MSGLGTHCSSQVVGLATFVQVVREFRAPSATLNQCAECFKRFRVQLNSDGAGSGADAGARMMATHSKQPPPGSIYSGFTPVPALAHLSRAAKTVELWAFRQGARGIRLRRIVGLLDEEFLLRLPLPPGTTEVAETERRKHLRYCFRRIAAHLLGWSERRSEGSDNGFSEDVNRVRRLEVFPDR
jgi:hypothetical protein